MLRNKLYVYGNRDVTIPTNVNFGDYILGRLWSFKDDVALINGVTDERLTYGQIVQTAMNLAVSLVRHGIRKGETIAIVSENNLEYFSTVFGVACAGATVTTMNPWYTKDEITHAVKIGKPTYVICSYTAFKTHKKVFHQRIKNIIIYGTERARNTILFNDLVQPESSFNFVKNNVENNVGKNVARLKANVKYEEFVPVDVFGQEDTAFVLYSSGTTGMSKGVALTHHNVISLCAAVPIQFSEGIVLGVGPWFHAMGLMGTISGFADHKTFAYIPKFEINVFLDVIEKYKTSMLFAAPAVFVALLKQKVVHDVSSVTRILTGAAPLHPDVMDEIRIIFPNLEFFRLGYGMTETSLAVTRNYVVDNKLLRSGTVGTLLPNLTLKVIDERHQPLGPNQKGEICVKGDVLMKGYLGASASPLDEEGFFLTGDLGYYDEDGHLFVVDRLKELIKYKGNQVPPAEIEAVLIQHKAVKEVGVVGLKDKEAGQLPLAFVVLQPGVTATEKELQDFVAEKLSSPKHLRGGVRFIPEIPRNTTGKILRNVLNKMANK